MRLAGGARWREREQGRGRGEGSSLRASIWFFLLVPLPSPPPGSPVYLSDLNVGDALRQQRGEDQP